VRSYVSGHQRIASSTPTIPSGTLMMKIHSQLANSTSTPPSTGPRPEAASAITAISASPRPRIAGGKTSAVIAKPSGAISPAPIPCSVRKPISQPMSQEVAHSALAIVKIVRPAMKNFLRPNWSARRPAVISSTANAML
jgi:hypothetical protein